MLMRRLLLPALLIFALSATAPWALAQIDASSADAAKREVRRAPLRVPETAPARDHAEPSAYVYRASGSIAASMAAADSSRTSHAQEPVAIGAASASATVTITATVLPTATIVIDDADTVRQIVINTPERRASNIVFLARRGSDSGAVIPITQPLWTSSIRPALANLSAGSGTVYRAHA